MPREAGFKHSLCADIDGLGLHAAVRCAADDRWALEQLCRTITRPAQDRRARASQRRGPGGPEAQDPQARRHHAPGDASAGVHAAAGGMGDRRAPFGRSCPNWLATIRLHLIRCHGVLAPASTTSAKLRATVVPQEPEPPGRPHADAAHRVRGERCASPPAAAELGTAAQAGDRERPGARPELRRRAEDHGGDP